MSDKTITVFVTKYWSTAGIGTDKVRHKDGSKYVYGLGSFMQQYILGRTCFLTETEARDAVTKEARKKVASLRAKADELEKKWLR